MRNGGHEGPAYSDDVAVRCHGSMTMWQSVLWVIEAMVTDFRCQEAARQIGEGRQTNYGSSPYVPCGSPIPWVSPDVFYPDTLPKSINIDMGWPTSLIGGDRPGGSKLRCGWA